MASLNRKRRRGEDHPYLAGNFAPVHQTYSSTPCSFTGELPEELAGGQYVRNGGNSIMNQDLGKDYHWFDGDGMLAGVSFEKIEDGTQRPIFTNQHILTDLYLAGTSSPSLQSHIVPSISTLVNPAASLIRIVWTILRTVLLILFSYLPGSKHPIKRISVANTGLFFHDGRALATCDSGPPMRVSLPSLDTVGWYNGLQAEGEKDLVTNEVGFGGGGFAGWIREWTTGHPKVDPTTGELLLFHCTFLAPYVQYSVVPAEAKGDEKRTHPTVRMFNAAVPGVGSPKMMHDFGVSLKHTVIMDLPLSLDPLNLAKNRPVVSYDPSAPSRFGVFPRYDPSSVRWFETSSCCIFHTANTWDEANASKRCVAVNFLACRLTSPAPLFVAGNIDTQHRPSESTSIRGKKRPSFFASYDHDELYSDEADGKLIEPSSNVSEVDDPFERSSALESRPIGSAQIDDVAEEEQCRLYYYRFCLDDAKSDNITHQFALSAIPFEFPTVHPLKEMSEAQYIYGCSTSTSSFNVALGKSVKIDTIVKMNALSLISKGMQNPQLASTDCVDRRTIARIMVEDNEDDDIACFKLPEKWFAQEARFVPRKHAKREDDGYLLFYAFDESQLDEDGYCSSSAVSELWVLDARTMKDVVCRIKLPQRVPYGFHGNFFTEKQIKEQREVLQFRKVPASGNGFWNGVHEKLVGLLG